MWVWSPPFSRQSQLCVLVVLTHVLWARCQVRLSDLFWGRTGDGTQGLGHGRHTLCPWAHLPHFVLFTQPVWVLGKLAGASHFPLVVFPAWFPVRCVCVVPIGYFRAGLDWRAGPQSQAHLFRWVVRVVARATPMLRCSSCLCFPPAPTASGCSSSASPWLTLLPAPVTVGGGSPTGKKQRAWSNENVGQHKRMPSLSVFHTLRGIYLPKNDPWLP